MTSVWPRLEPLLPHVSKPARYIGCEDGAQRPTHGPGIVSWLLTYPDTYEIGLPNQGLQILYEILNERDDAAAERSYAPWGDLEERIRDVGIPLFSVETHRPAGLFDILAFNLSAELTYTNLLNCVDLAGVAVRSAERAHDDPLIGVGGHCTYNPEPIADFVDFVVLGDGEEVVSEITEVVGEWKRAGKPSGGRERVLRDLAGVTGVYVPSLYDVRFDGARLVEIVLRFADVPERIEKRTVADLADWPYPKQQLVPLTEVVHDRLNVEVFRGCTRGCRFCQAGMITRPVRERPADQVRHHGARRTATHRLRRGRPDLAQHGRLQRHRAGRGRHRDRLGMWTGLGCASEPSRRCVHRGDRRRAPAARRTGLTFAPEAGTWRMRQIINKLILEEDLYGAVESAYSQGWRRMKLYFLTGLPTETDEDTLGIAELARNCVALGRSHQKSPSVTISVGGFVPKPFTPFQWFGQNTTVELQRKIDLLRDDLRRERGVQLKWHDPKATLVEGIASRGDRRLGPVIEQVWRSGGTFQEWSEHFNHDLWLESMATHGLDVDWYVHRHRTEDEVLPWDHLSAGLHKDFLWQDWRDASRRWASRIVVGRRATTAVPAPDTESSMWSRRPPRPQAVARAPESTGVGGARFPSPFIRDARWGPVSDEAEDSFHQAWKDPIHLPS